MKTYGEVDVQTHAFLTSVLVGSEWLHDKIKLNKPKHKCYVTDYISETKDILFWRPPYHPDRKYIELIGEDVKQRVESKNTAHKITDVKQLSPQIRRYCAGGMGQYIQVSACGERL
jgi:transposase